MNINRGYDEKERLFLSIKHAEHAHNYSKEIQQDAISQSLVNAMCVSSHFYFFD